MQDSLPAGWIAFTGREFNPLVQCERFRLHYVPLSRASPDASWSHGRRKFIDAINSNAADLDSAAIVKLIDELFAIDRKARDEGITIAERQALRKEQAPMILDELHPRA
jgi:hypothetical protein